MPPSIDERLAFLATIAPLAERIRDLARQEEAIRAEREQAEQEFERAWASIRAGMSPAPAPGMAPARPVSEDAEEESPERGAARQPTESMGEPDLFTRKEGAA